MYKYLEHMLSLSYASDCPHFIYFDNCFYIFLSAGGKANWKKMPFYFDEQPDSISNLPTDDTIARTAAGEARQQIQFFT